MIGTNEVSAELRAEILDALRRGTVPSRGLGRLAVGLEPFVGAVDAELERTAGGGAGFKAVRGEYGAGKTFFVRWLQESARARGFVTAEVQISENETPLHRLETVYRRAMERLSTSGVLGGALSVVVDSWLVRLEDDALGSGAVAEGDDEGLERAIEDLMERRLAVISRSTPQFAAVLRAYHRATIAGDLETAQGLIAWLGGQRTVAASIKGRAGIKGEVDHFGALSFLTGLLTVLRDAGFAGMVLVLDEVETLQRVRGDVREKGLNALRQLVDEIDAQRFPGLYLVMTGTPAFFDGTQGVKRLAPLESRLATNFSTDGRFDNPRAPQIRLSGFDHERLVELGKRVRDLYATGSVARERILERVDDAYVADLSRALVGHFGGAARVVPRLFLKKLVLSVLDLVEQFEEFDPRGEHASIRVERAELTDDERAAVQSVDDVELEL